MCFAFAVYNVLYIIGCKLEGNACAHTLGIALVSFLGIVVYSMATAPDSLLGQIGLYLVLACVGVRQSGTYGPGGGWLEKLEISANFRRLVLSCIEANFCK